MKLVPMKQGETFLAVLLLVTSVTAAWLYDRDTTKLKQERDGLRAQVTALRAAEANQGYCGVTRNGPRVVCALRGSGSTVRLQYTEISDGSVICAVLRNQNRAECTLADGRRIVLRR